MVNYKAPCKYYGKCGGCQLQHIENHGEFKFNILQEQLNKLNSSLQIHPLFQVNKYSRRRAGFKALNNRLSFSYYRSNKLIAIDECIVIEPELNMLIKPVNSLLQKMGARIKEIFFTSSDTGIEIVLSSEEGSSLNDQELLTDFAKKYNISRVAWQIKDYSPTIIVQLNPVQIKFNDISIDLPIKSFLQVSRESFLYMSELVTKLLDQNYKTIELFCGAGSFTIKIYNKLSKLTAVEGAEEAIVALRNAVKQNNLNVNVILRDLFKAPLSVDELSSFQQVVINPPRNGAGPQVKEIANSASIKKIIMISCSLENFIRDSSILLSKGFELLDIYPVDQFLYSNHLELIANYIRK